MDRGFYLYLFSRSPTTRMSRKYLRDSKHSLTAQYMFLSFFIFRKRLPSSPLKSFAMLNAIENCQTTATYNTLTNNSKKTRKKEDFFLIICTLLDRRKTGQRTTPDNISDVIGIIIKSNSLYSTKKHILVEIFWRNSWNDNSARKKFKLVAYQVLESKFADYLIPHKSKLCEGIFLLFGDLRVCGFTGHEKYIYIKKTYGII